MAEEGADCVQIHKLPLHERVQMKIRTLQYKRHTIPQICKPSLEPLDSGVQDSIFPRTADLEIVNPTLNFEKSLTIPFHLKERFQCKTPLCEFRQTAHLV
jgi:hypothetical protein